MLPALTTCAACRSATALHVYFFTEECVLVIECPSCGASDTKKGLDPDAVRQSLAHSHNFSPGTHLQIYDLDSHFRELIESLFPDPKE